MSAPGEQYLSWLYASRVWAHTTFLGVSALKSVSDMWNYQEILTDLQPSLVLEFGTFCGGSALYFAEILRLVSPHSRVLTVDLDHAQVDRRVREHDRIELLASTSTSPMVAARFAQLRQAYPGKAFCILDSDHHMQHVLDELLLLRGLTRPGDYVVVEDGCINGHPVFPDWGPGPYEAIEEYFRRFPDDYTPDSAREQKFGFTLAPGGFLIRR